MQLSIRNLKGIVVFGLKCLLYRCGGREVPNDFSVVIIEVLEHSDLCFCFDFPISEAG